MTEFHYLHLNPYAERFMYSSLTHNKVHALSHRDVAQLAHKSHSELQVLTTPATTLRRVLHLTQIRKLNVSYALRRFVTTFKSATVAYPEPH